MGENNDMPRKEIWTQIEINGIVFFEQAVSSLGRVRGITGKIRKLQQDKDGYNTVMLRTYYEDDEGNKKLFRVNAKVHRLVADAFVDNPDDLKCVSHKDSNKRNNIASNLYYSDLKTAIRKEVKVKTEKKRLTESLVKEILRFKGDGLSCKETADALDMHYSQVYHAYNRETWKHVEL